MADIIQIRRDTAANWTTAATVLANGEIGYETDTGNLKIGDGTTAWASLAYFIGGEAGVFSEPIASNYVAGAGAGAALATGAINNFLVGANTGATITTEDNSVYIGKASGRYATGADTILIGQDAGGGTGTYGISAAGNISMGRSSMRYASTASSAVAIGYYAMSGASGTPLTGANNTAIGSRAGYVMQGTAASNTACGSYSLYSTTTGANNTVVGRNSGFEITTGSNNVCLGYFAGPTTNQSSKLYIDNSKTDTPLIGGDFTADTVTVNGAFNALTATAGVVGIKSEVTASTGILYAGFFNQSNAAHTGASYGVYAIASAKSGIGVLAVAGGDTARGVNVQASGVTGVGVYVTANGTNGQGVTVRGSGTGFRGLDVQATAASGAIFAGHFSANSASHTTTSVGVHGSSASTLGRGVEAYATGASSYALHAWNTGSGGTGVLGLTTGTAGIGVEGASSTAGGIGGFFQNTDGTDTEVKLGLATDLIVGSVDAAEKFKITDAGVATFVGGVDALTSATGIVSVAAATAPTVGQVLTATSGVVATWQDTDGLFNEDASFNIVGGTGAGAAISTGVSNFLAGQNAGALIAATSDNIVIGDNALVTAAAPANSTAIGVDAMRYAASATDCVAIGIRALNGVNTDTLLQLRATAVGSQTGMYSEGTTDCIFIGHGAGQGSSTLVKNTGDENTFIGNRSGLSNKSGDNNTALGYDALKCAFGSELTGNHNTAIGHSALSVVATTANSNTALGALTGANISTGVGNVLIGYGAGPTTNQSSKLYIDNTETDTPLIGGDFSANTVDITGTLSVSGGVDALTSATTAVDVSAATAPSADQVLTATSSTVATWQTPAPLTLVTNTKTASYTAVLGDAEEMITVNNASANTFTIPANASVAYAVGTQLHVMQLGAGATTVAITTDTLNVNADLTKVLNGQYAVATAIKVTSTTWTLFGNLVAA